MLNTVSVMTTPEMSSANPMPMTVERGSSASGFGAGSRHRWTRIACLAVVSDRSAWLRPGTRASFGYKCGRTSSFDPDVLRKGWVTEVSVLTAGHEPLEPGARVLTLREDANPILPVAPAGATVIAGNGQIIRRPVGQVLAVR